MDLREDTSGDVTILEIKGRIDSTTAPVLGERLTASLTRTSRRLVLDLRQLEYISSAGFRVLLLAARRARGGRRERASSSAASPARSATSSISAASSISSSSLASREEAIASVR